VYFSAVVGACATGALVHCVTRPDRYWVDLVTALGVGILAIAGVNSETVVDGVPRLARWLSASHPHWENPALSALDLARVCATNLLLIGAAVSAGELVAKGLRAQSYLVLAAIVAAVADTYSVAVGPTAKLAGSETALRHMALHWPAIGGGAVIPIVGVGDFLFLSIFLVGARKFSLGALRNLVALMASFAVGFAFTIIGTVLFGIPGLPALPFMCVAFLVVNWRRLRVSSEERTTVIKVSAMFAVAFLVLGIAKALGWM
jgi:hypothetical protein